MHTVKWFVWFQDKPTLSSSDTYIVFAAKLLCGYLIEQSSLICAQGLKVNMIKNEQFKLYLWWWIFCHSDMTVNQRVWKLSAPGVEVL